ncbi:HlyD family efflux transporter periplasmic adaptor subunit [bacterium]|nr:HlyD family efflux transporter periplasmic adaptor subunit [bacterium]
MFRFAWPSLVTIAVCGCTVDSRESESFARVPRPVSVILLREFEPSKSLAMTGTVGSWKTEQLGFEVSGRVQYVIEPETNVDSARSGRDDTVVLARIDPERYETAVESAKARIVMLERSKNAAEIERDQVLPAQRDAAIANQELAQSDFDRAKDLFAKEALAKAEFDKYSATLKSATAQVAQIDATHEARSAEISSLDAQIDQAKAALKDAQRDLSDCSLKAPFRGQIAHVHLIPGGTVQRGEPVVTLQMMDPIKVEFEVSAERVRSMRYREEVAVLLDLPDGSSLTESGIIYLTDPVADSSTRTFTVTVLVRNRLLPTAVPDGIDRNSLPRTHDLWKPLRGIFGDPDRYYVEQFSIHHDAEGDYVWKIVGNSSNDRRSPGPLLTVEKVRVTAGNRTDSFLGLWTFRDLTFNDPGSFNLEHDRLIGKLVLPEGQAELTGQTVLFEREQWLLRPGDLVRVDLNEGNLQSGLYVPIDAIKNKSGTSSVFVVDDSDTGSKVRQIEVTVSDGPDTLKRITARGDATLPPGTRIVLGGVHYLVDGERVNVTSEVETF